MIRIQPVTALCALAVAIAAPAFAEETGEPTPAWRLDAGHLEADLSRLQDCFAAAGRGDAVDEAPCIGTVVDACRAEIGEDAAMTTAGARGCFWRAIAAWEDVLAEALGAAHAALPDEARAAHDEAQAAWEAYLLTKVRATSAPLEGGSLQGLVAAEVRARMVAERAVEVRALALTWRQ